MTLAGVAAAPDPQRVSTAGADTTGRRTDRSRTPVRRDQRGLSDSLQWTLLTPVLLLAVLGTIQAGILMHGHNVAENAAQAAAQAESAYLSAGTGTEQALAVAQVGGLTDVTVTVRRGPTKVEVGVSARIPVFLDLGQGRVSESASAPIERVTEP